jgi:HK97 family phage portal protein
MKWMAAPFRAAGRGWKAFTMRFSTYGSYLSGLFLPRTNFDYAREIGDGSRSNIVQAVVGWIARTFPEARVIIVREQDDGTRERQVGHRLPRLLERPNPYYSGTLLWMATISDWSITGNGYWIKERVRGGPLDGMVERLWWAPSWTMEPHWPDDGKTFIDYYEYKPSGEYEGAKISPEDVVHFRYGLDATNTRKGCSPLRSLMREIFTDEEAANFTAALMKNLGVPGIVVSPEVPVSIEQAQESKQTIMERFTGDKRGEPWVMTGPTKVQVLSFSPEQMLLRDLRRVPEERVTAVYGVAAVVVGLGAGLDRATFTNFAEAREAATEGNIIPTQRMIAADLTLQLGPDFWGDDPAMSVEFDPNSMRVLQPDMDKMATRMAQLVRDGIATRYDGRLAMGLPTSDDDRVYYVQRNVMLVAEDNEPLTDLEPAPALPAPKSNGHDPAAERELVA